MENKKMAEERRVQFQYMQDKNKDKVEETVVVK